MDQKKKKYPKVKSGMHPLNKHRERYDFKELIVASPELAKYVQLNKYKDESINFSDPKAVKALNKALLKQFYDIEKWDIPPGYLCPPIPGRADYIHHIAGLLQEYNYGKIPSGRNIICLDIGVGANCIYPIIGHKEYNWSFIGADIDSIAIDNAANIVHSNKNLNGKIELRLQTNPKDFFYGVIKKDEPIDLSICNPPFHASAADAETGTLRKLNNLNSKKVSKPTLNFGGKNNELWCEGGEERFLRNMIKQSKKFANTCFLFSSLVSKQSNLKSIYKSLKKAEAQEIKTIPMGQGNKTSRIVAWSFFTKEQQRNWVNSRWRVNV